MGVGTNVFVTVWDRRRESDVPAMATCKFNFPRRAADQVLVFSEMVVGTKVLSQAWG